MMLPADVKTSLAPTLLAAEDIFALANVPFTGGWQCSLFPLVYVWPNCFTVA